MDLNQRPVDYEPTELPNCSIPQKKVYESQKVKTVR